MFLLCPNCCEHGYKALDIDDISIIETRLLIPGGGFKTQRREIIKKKTQRTETVSGQKWSGTGGQR